MSISSKFFKFIYIYIFSIAIIFFYIVFLINFYLKPNNLDLPVVLLFGFVIIIVGVFYFFLSIYKNKKQNEIIINFKFLSEDSIKIVFLFLMIVTFFIPSVTFSETIIAWNQIGFFSYLKAFIFLFGSMFIPGACIYRIFFSNNTLKEKLNIELFFLKITIYPIISLSYFGIFTFLLDNIGLKQEYFILLLFFSIIVLFFIDFLIQKQRERKRFEITSKIVLSKFTLLILFFSLGTIIICLGIHLSSQYLIPGDRWRGFMTATLVGSPEINITDDTSRYTIYWGYISFALSTLCGIPYVNINALLFLFQYMFISSIYLLMKAILRNLKEVYALLSTILFLIFSGLFYFSSQELNYYQFTILGLLQFSYHTFAFISLFLSLALYISTINISNNDKLKIISKKQDLKIIFLAAFFMLQSFFTYFLPAIAGISLIIIYSLFSKNKQYSLKALFNFWLFIILIFIPLNTISFFYFSWIPVTLLSNFLGFPIYIQATLFSMRRFLTSILVTLILIVFLIIIHISKLIYEKYYLRRFKKYRKTKINLIFVILYGIFSILINIWIIFSSLMHIEQGFVIFYLNLIFLNIGLIGIIGIYSLHCCFKKDKTTFYVLIVWTILLIGLSSILIFRSWVVFYPNSPFEIPEESFYYMMYWFERIWFYSIIPLSISASFGILSLRKYLKFNKSKSSRLISTELIVFILIFFSFSNTIITGMYWNTRQDYYVLDEEAQMIGWISKNIDRNSNILIDRYRLKPRIDDLTYSTTYYLWEEENKALENYTGFLTSYRYDSNCLFEAENNYEGHDNVTVFNDQNDFGQINLDIKLDSKQTNGSIEFFVATNNTSKCFYIYLGDSLKLTGIILSIKNNYFNLYDGNTHLNVSNIERNKWYHIKIDFECTDGNFTGLEKDKYRLTINGNVTIISNLLNFINNIQFITFISDYHDYGMKIYLDNINFSWVPNYDIEKYFFYPIVLINHLKDNNIQYFVISKNLSDYYKYKDLIKYYNKKLYEYLNLVLYCPN